MVSEAERTTKFLKFAKAKIHYTFSFEAKICKLQSLSFTALKPHQERALLIVKQGSFNYKIGDTGFNQKPFDGFQLYKEKSFVVIFWYQKRGDKRFTMIDINKWIEEKNNSERKSITYNRATEIAYLTDSL